MKRTWESCPICHGTGETRAGFYPSEPERTECRTCNGKGALQTWEISQRPYEFVPYPSPYPVPAPLPFYEHPPFYPWRITTGDTANLPLYTIIK